MKTFESKPLLTLIKSCWIFDFRREGSPIQHNMARVVFVLIQLITGWGLDYNQYSLKHISLITILVIMELWASTLLIIHSIYPSSMTLKRKAYVMSAWIVTEILLLVISVETLEKIVWYGFLLFISTIYVLAIGLLCACMFHVSEPMISWKPFIHVSMACIASFVIVYALHSLSIHLYHSSFIQSFISTPPIISEVSLASSIASDASTTVLSTSSLSF